MDIHGARWIWRPWVAGDAAIGSGHHPAEQAPDELARALSDFLVGSVPSGKFVCTDGH